MSGACTCSSQTSHFNGFTYCAVCSTALMERSVKGHKILLCSSCGAMFVQPDEFASIYRYAGTTNGSQQLRELLSTIDKEEQTNEAMALETNTSSR